jgi:hypothetical protein
MYGAILSGITGKVPEWAQNLTEEEMKALGADIQGIKDYNQATYNSNLNPTKKGSGSELLGRVFKGQSLLDKGLMDQTKYEELFPGNIPPFDGRGNDNILPQYAMMGGGADLGSEDAVEDVTYDWHLGKEGQGIGRDVTLGYLASGGRARRANGGIMGTRARRAMGGIMGRVDQRQGYFLGGIGRAFKGAVSGVVDATKKVLKSDVGKMALMAAGTYYLGGGMKFGGAKMFNNTGFGMEGFLGNMGRLKTLAGSGIDKYKSMGKLGKALTWGAAGLGLSMIPGLNKAKPNETSFSDRGGRLKDSQGNEVLPSGIRAEINDAYESGDPERIAAIQKYYAFLPPTAQHMPYENYGEEGYRTTVATGGRIGKAEGGLMDLGGMEKDYRAEGGFVPIGAKEKADDVPARLSVNEFVFTADAVRGAGDGDIDKGAEVMENMMVNLEKGGTVSEESQGNAGAQQMFNTSERLGEVI